MIKWGSGIRPTTEKWSFLDRTPWPRATIDGKTVATIVCDTPYSIAVANSGKHAPLKIMLAPSTKSGVYWRQMPEEVATLDEAKIMVEKYFTGEIQ